MKIQDEMSKYNLNNFDQFLDQIDPKIGKMGGRKYKIKDLTGSLTIEQIIAHAEQLANKSEGKDQSKVGVIFNKIQELRIKGVNSAALTRNLKEAKTTTGGAEATTKEIVEKVSQSKLGKPLASTRADLKKQGQNVLRDVIYTALDSIQYLRRLGIVWGAKDPSVVRLRELRDQETEDFSSESAQEAITLIERWFKNENREIPSDLKIKIKNLQDYAAEIKK